MLQGVCVCAKNLSVTMCTVYTL